MSFLNLNLRDRSKWQQMTQFFKERFSVELNIDTVAKQIYLIKLHSFMELCFKDLKDFQFHENVLDRFIKCCKKADVQYYKKILKKSKFVKCSDNSKDYYVEKVTHDEQVKRREQCLLILDKPSFRKIAYDKENKNLRLFHVQIIANLIMDIGLYMLKRAMKNAVLHKRSQIWDIDMDDIILFGS